MRSAAVLAGTEKPSTRGPALGDCRMRAGPPGRC